MGSFNISLFMFYSPFFRNFLQLKLKKKQESVLPQQKTQAPEPQNYAATVPSPGRLEA